MPQTPKVFPETGLFPNWHNVHFKKAPKLGLGRGNRQARFPFGFSFVPDHKEQTSKGSSRVDIHQTPLSRFQHSH